MSVIDISNIQFSHFFADPHWGHANIIKYESRPFSCVEEMNATLIDRYNAAIKPDQTCLWVGDVFFRSFQLAAEIMKQLNGKKILVRGNHDRSAGSMAKLGFMAVTNELTLSIGGKPVRVSHYPYWKDWYNAQRCLERGFTPDQVEKLKNRYPKRIKGEILIHGHVHGKTRVRENMINVGVDAWEYAPVSMEEIEKLIEGM
jgi:calcineurin-like phosphoesterase family protein